jgi:hypothetical protein
MTETDAAMRSTFDLDRCRDKRRNWCAGSSGGAEELSAWLAGMR